jgi:uncharacterized phiE125 gp8 family phage protein
MISGQAIRIVPPAQLPVSLLELKAQIRYDASDEDALLQGYLQAAVDTAEEYTGLALLTQTWQQSLPAFADPMFLHRRPLIAVGSPLVAVTVQYLDGDEALQTLSDTGYRVTGIGGDHVLAAVRLGYGQSWPITRQHDEAVRITYTAGYGSSPTDVPQVIRHAILMLAATWFGYREDVVMGSTVSDELPFASKALLRPWRRLAVA